MREPPEGLDDRLENVPIDEPNGGGNGTEPPNRGAPPIGENGGKPSPPRLKIFDVGEEDGNIEPRGWLLGTTFCRRNLSGLISAGAGGKTTVRIVQLLSAACGRSLTGEHVFIRCRVLIVCLEDDMKELRRRVRAAMLHHNVTPAEVKGFLFLTTPRGLKIAERDRDSGTVAVGALYPALVNAVDDLKLDILCIDPAVKAHTLNENDNREIDAFASILTDLAANKNIAVDMLSHERKGVGGAGDVDRGRGAGSMKDAARLMRTLTGMSEDDGKALGVDEDARAFLVRIDNAKVNIAPPARTATWFHLVGVELGNGTETYPNGDNVQTVELWKPSSIFEGVSIASLRAAQNAVAAGRWREDSQAKDWVGLAIADVLGLDAKDPTDKTKIKNILKAWTHHGMFEVVEGFDEKRRPRSFIKVGKWADDD
jgi:hypothetical protein